MLLASASRVIICCGALGFRSSSHWTGHCGRHTSLIHLETSREDAQGRQRGRKGVRECVLKYSPPAAEASASTAATALEDRGACDVAEDEVAVKNRTGRSSSRLDLSVDPAQPSPPLDVLHENQDFGAVCKPPLMHVHRPEFGSKDKEFVLQKARNQLGRRIYLPHRLDRGTSGCLLVGFSPESVKVLHEALSHPTSTKTYVAIVRGSGQAFVDRGWFTVDRPMKDDKKVLREASTRFLFVRGGDCPDPRCCLVLAQPSTGRFHQIRRHLRGLSHPVVGDSVHGNSRFNREVVSHPSNAAPAGRLMLHCLQLFLPKLPDARSRVWKKSAEKTVAAEGEQMEEVYRGSRDKSEKTRLVQKDKGEPGRASCSGSGSEQEGMGVSNVTGSFSVSGGAQTPAQSEKQFAHNDDGVADRKTMMDGQEGGGLEVYAEPPGDMMAFLRGMSWWEEGMIQAAERSGR